MARLRSQIDTKAQAYTANRAGLSTLLRHHDAQVAIALAGGGEKYNARHRARGKMLARERIELLIDSDSAFLELSPLAGWGTQFQVGAGMVTGVAVISGVECVVIANDPTVKGATMNS